MPYKNEFIGAKCRDLRKAKRINQSTIAEELKMNRTNISKFERGDNDNLNIFLWYVAHGLDVMEIIQNMEGIIV